MILDQQLLFSDKQSLAAAAGTHPATNVVDLGPPDTMPWPGGQPLHDPGRGEPVEVLIQVTEAFEGGTSVQAQLVMSDAENLSNPTILAETAAVPTAELVPGYQFRLRTLPHGLSKRYLGVRYVTAGTFTAGAVTAGLILDRQSSPSV